MSADIEALTEAYNAGFAAGGDDAVVSMAKRLDRIVQRLSDEIDHRAAVEADLRARLAAAGGAS